MLPSIFKNTGLVPYAKWANVAGEHVGWILGGDLHLNENHISMAVKNYQPPTPQADLSTTIHMVDAGTPVRRHGDIALIQHMQAYQKASTIGKDFGGKSDAHNMVIVVAEWVPLAPASTARGASASGASDASELADTSRFPRTIASDQQAAFEEQTKRASDEEPA